MAIIKRGLRLPLAITLDDRRLNRRRTATRMNN